MQDRIIRILFCLLWIELCLGGGGRFTAWGPVSLRMVFFVAALSITVIAFVKGKRISNSYWRLVLLFLITTGIGLGIGLLDHADRKFWWEDVKPLLYFLILPFFALAIQNKTDVHRVARIIQGSGMTMMALFFIALMLIHTNAVPFLSFYNATVKTEEIFFRGEYTFFYKGFLFLGIAIIFFYFNVKTPINYGIIAFLLIALFLSLTRGFLLALSLTVFSYFLFKKSFLKAFIMVGIAVVVLLLGQNAISFTSRWLAQQTELHGNANKFDELNPALLGDRSFSDHERIAQLRQVAQGITFSSLLVGHGLGIGVPIRPVHMEISYLEIFHKQGLIGLTFWAILLWSAWQKFRAAQPSGLAEAFFFSTLFVFFQSFTNQYINNPIGLSMLLLTFVCLDQ